jgi:60 kDa SS-A/Ro ribonucleoprotein
LAQGDTKALAYQLLKYQQRHGFSNRDALRLFHIKPQTEDRDLLFKWVLNGWETLPDRSLTESLNQIWWYEWLKRNPSRTKEAIIKGRLTHEMAAPVGKMDRDAWQLLFEDMPIGALLRNLGSLTEIGVLAHSKENRAWKKNLDRVANILNSKDRLRKGRIHPIDILQALKTYKSCGSIGRSCLVSQLSIPDGLERRNQLPHHRYLFSVLNGCQFAELPQTLTALMPELLLCWKFLAI